MKRSMVKKTLSLFLPLPAPVSINLVLPLTSVQLRMTMPILLKGNGFLKMQESMAGLYLTRKVWSILQAINGSAGIIGIWALRLVNFKKNGSAIFSNICWNLLTFGKKKKQNLISCLYLFRINRSLPLHCYEFRTVQCVPLYHKHFLFFL